MNHPVKYTSSFEGHKLALAVAGLALFGLAPCLDGARLDQLGTTLAVTGNAWIVGPLNDSEAVATNIAALESLDEEAFNANFTAAALTATAGFLEEVGGLDGLAALREDILGNARQNHLDALKLGATTLHDEIVAATHAVGEQAPTAKVVHIDLSGNVQDQLKAAGLPDELAAVLSRIG